MKRWISYLCREGVAFVVGAFGSLLAAFIGWSFAPGNVAPPYPGSQTARSVFDVSIGPIAALASPSFINSNFELALAMNSAIWGIILSLLVTATTRRGGTKRARTGARP